MHQRLRYCLEETLEDLLSAGRGHLVRSLFELLAARMDNTFTYTVVLVVRPSHPARRPVGERLSKKNKIKTMSRKWRRSPKTTMGLSVTRMEMKSSTAAWRLTSSSWGNSSRPDFPPEIQPGRFPHRQICSRVGSNPEGGERRARRDECFISALTSLQAQSRSGD